MKTRQPISSRLLQTAWLRWRDNVTPAAKCLFIAVVFAALGSISVVIPIYQVFCSLAALLGVAEIAGFVFWPKVSIAGQFPEKTSVGQPATGEFVVTNLARRPAHDLTLGFFGLPDSLAEHDAGRTVPYLPRGGSTTIPVTLQPLRRGLYELPPLRARSTFPLNLASSGSSRLEMRSLLVLPAFHAVEGIDIPLNTRYQPGGIALTSNVGESPEYIGNREYIPGEPARRLDFRSWARLGKPVVREFQEEYYCRIALILDTFVPPGRKAGPDGFPDLEAGVSLAASVADALSGGEYIIDIFAAGSELYVFRAGRHTAHFENVLEILACVDACRENPFEIILPAIADELNNISTAVCVFLDWDASRRQIARTVLEAGCRLKVLIVRDGDTTDPLDVGDGGEISQYTPAQVRDGGLEIR